MAGVVSTRIFGVIAITSPMSNRHLSYQRVC